MADETQKQETTQTPEGAQPVAPEAPKAAEGDSPPETFELEELEKLRFAATNAKIGRTIAEFKLRQMQIQQLSEAQKQADQEITALNDEQDQLLAVLGERVGVGLNIRRYSINLETGVCTLKRPQPAPRLPGGIPAMPVPQPPKG